MKRFILLMMYFIGLEALDDGPMFSSITRLCGSFVWKYKQREKEKTEELIFFYKILTDSIFKS